MPNKILRCVDLLIWRADRVARFCKSINGKLFGTISTAIVCCAIVSLLGTDALKSIPVVKSAYYDTIVANFPEFVDFLSADIGKVIFLFTLLVVGICYLLRKWHRPFAALIAHSTMGYDLSILDESLKNSFRFIKKRIDIQLPSRNASKDQVITAVHAQDESFKEIQEGNWCSTIFYYGVAHTPLVFRLGYQWGQTKKIRFLHRFRPIEDEQEFKELPQCVEEKVSFLLSNRFDASNDNLESKHLLASIATTYPIGTKELLSIDPSNTMLHYDIQVDMMGFDFFNSYYKMHSYADRIIADLRKIVKERGIEIIHFAIASSVPFTFYLAQQMNTHQFCKIIVYHFDHGKYTWGIDVTEPKAEKAVRWDCDTTN